MPDPFVPTPPEGWLALTSPHEARDIDERNRDKSARISERHPINGVLVYVERDWHPVSSIGARHGAKIDVRYTGSKLPGALDGGYQQRVPAERIAVDPAVQTRIPELREHQARQQAEQEQRQAEYEAGRAQREADRRAVREEYRAEKAAREAARIAAMDPHERLALVRRQLAVGRELVLSRREAVEEARAALAEVEQLVERLAAEETELVAQQGEYQ